MRFLSRVDSNTGNDPDLEASAGNWFLIRTSEEIVHTAGRFYAPGTVVNSTGGAADVFICRRPTTDTPSEFDADWYHLPRGATVLEATTTASPYRSGTLVYIGDNIYFCHTSVPSPGVTAALLPANANFAAMTADVNTLNSLRGTGSAGDPLDLNVAGSSFPIITIEKGGTNAATATGARLSLGLGTAAVRDVGDASSNVAVLQPDTSFTAGHLAPGGTVGQVLTRTGSGKEWADLGALDFRPYFDWLLSIPKWHRNWARRPTI